MDSPPRVVALVPAFNSAKTVRETVLSLRAVPNVVRVLVIDDGSSDQTADTALAAGARVLRLPNNVGKGDAVAAGLASSEASGDAADVFLLVDADTAESAALAAALLGPIENDSADMTIAILPNAGRSGGTGLVRKWAARLIKRACGFEAIAPLSGQRAIRASTLKAIGIASRFGMETALTIDACRQGACVIEMPVAMNHAHRGRTITGFIHRARQGIELTAAAWPRITGFRTRVGIVVTLAVVAIASSLWWGGRSEPDSVAMRAVPHAKVIVLGIPTLNWSDLEGSAMPNLKTMMEHGAVGAMTVRTASTSPSTEEGYATLGAGVRVAAHGEAAASFDATEQLFDEPGSAAEVLKRRTNATQSAEVFAVGAAATQRLNSHRHLGSTPGSLGDALHANGKRTAVVGNADFGGSSLTGSVSKYRPSAIALTDNAGYVDFGTVSSELLERDPESPYGYRASIPKLTKASEDALQKADVLLIDSGDMDRARRFDKDAMAQVSAAARVKALARQDDLLGALMKIADTDTTVLVVSVRPGGSQWRITPVIAAGPTISRGYIDSPSTRRLGLVTITDVAPTVLQLVGASKPDEMIGHSMTIHHGAADLVYLSHLDRDAAYRERIYIPLTIAFVVVQAIAYLLAMTLFGVLPRMARLATWLKWTALAIAAWPASTFVFRAIPNIAAAGSVGVLCLIGIDIALVALAGRFRRRALSPLSSILGFTVVLLVVDVITGARLQTSSLLGYSLHTAARFSGLGNTAFATLAASTILFAAIHIHYSERRMESLVGVGALFTLVALVDGFPSLGSDVGGILTLLPVFGLSLFGYARRRVSLRMLVFAGIATICVLGAATVFDVSRASQSQTHLGQLASQVHSEGLKPLKTTISRKLATNLRTYKSTWSWAVLIISVYMLFVLGWTKGWTRLLPSGSALRVGVVGALAAGLLGYATNDSGVVVTAVVFVFIGPLLTLLALQQALGQPTLYLDPSQYRNDVRYSPKTAMRLQPRAWSGE